jgi:hypothetical protein
VAPAFLLGAYMEFTADVELLQMHQDLRDGIADLVAALHCEVGKKWMSIGLRFQLEKIEELLRIDPPELLVEDPEDPDFEDLDFDDDSFEDEEAAQ